MKIYFQTTVFFFLFLALATASAQELTKKRTKKVAANAGSSQTIAPDNTNIAYRGVIYPNVNSTGAELLRLPEKLLKEAKPRTHGFNPEKGRVAAGGSIVIATDSPTVNLTFDTSKRMKFGIYQNDDFTGMAKLDKTGKLNIKSADPGKVINYRIAFPNFDNPIFTGLVIDEKFSLQPPAQPREKVYVALGDSITHGRGQATSNETWGWHVAEALKMEFYNLAIGGSNANAFQPTAIADLPNVELVTILWGYNDWVNKGKTVEEFTQDINAALDVIRAEHPETPVAVLRLLQTTTTVSKRTENQFTADDFRQAADDLVATRKAAGDNNIHVIASDTLTTTEDLKDSVHLSVEGAAKFGTAMSKILTPLVK